MGNRKEAEALMQDFIEFCGLADLDYQYMVALPPAEVPEKIRVVRIKGQPYRVCPTVDNARRLLTILETGKKKILRKIREITDANKNRELSMSQMIHIGTKVGEALWPYYIEVLRVTTMQAYLNADYFTPLAQLTGRTIDEMEDLINSVLYTYEQKLGDIAENKQHRQQELDARTAQIIANQPVYVQIRGTIKDGFLGPKFSGTATATPTMSQGQVIQAYSGNRSTAWYEGYRATKQAVDQLMDYLYHEAKSQINRFYSEFLRTYGTHCPNYIYGPALYADDVLARPYSWDNLMYLIDTAPKEEMGKIKILDEYYKMHFIPHFEKILFNDILEHYKKHGNCDYSHKRLDFYYAYSDLADVFEDADLYEVFVAYFKEIIIARQEEMWADKKLKVRKTTTVEDLFGDILQRASTCKALTPAIVESMRKGMGIFLERLKEDRIKGLAKLLS